MFQIPRLVWWALYTGAILLAILVWFNRLPLSIFYTILVLLPVGSIILLVMHAIFQEDSRRLVFLLAAGIAIVILPPLLFGLLDNANPNLRASTFLALPALPAAYFFAIYWLQFKQLENQAKRLFTLYVSAIIIATVIVVILAYLELWFNASQPELIYSSPPILLSIFIGLISILPFLVLPAIQKQSYPSSFSTGQLELRSNRLVSLYLFFTLLGVTLAAVVVLVLSILPYSSEIGMIVAVVAVILAMLATALGFEPFQRAVERRVLGIPLPPTQLLETYSASITTSLDQPRLAQLLRDELLPSLLVRQSALLRVENGQGLIPLYLSGIESSDLPKADQVPALLGDSGSSGQFSFNDQKNENWVRIVFPLRIRDELIGL